jgi:hypothetical protein
MTPVLALLLTRMYPRPWRERYGAEFEALLEDGDGGSRTLLNVIWSAVCERVSPTQGGTMHRDPLSFGSMTRQLSAFLPLAMSLTALTVVLGHIAFFGAVREADEGAVAHIWQLLMAGQIPIVAIFAVKWLPKAPRPALGVLALQAGAVLASMAPVAYFNL